MKLNRVIALMGILGLVSGPVFAQASNPSATATDNTTTPAATTDTSTAATAPATTAPAVVHKHHHHHHHVVHHHVVVHKIHHEPIVQAQPVDYKNEAPPPTEVCSISHESMILDSATQSVGRSMPSPCNPAWFNRIQLSGGINVDGGKWGNRNAGYMGENYQRLSLNDAYLNVGAVINDWARAFASISYNTATTVQDGFLTGEYSAAYSNNVQSLTSNNNLQLEQGYVTIGNFDVSPIYVQVGKQFQDFSRYDIHPIEASMTQVLSETLATSAKIGFVVPMGFNGSVAVFDDPVKKLWF